MGGANRYEVAVNVAKQYQVGTAPTVFVASGEVFPDALTGGAAAAKEGAPLLLVSGDSIAASVTSELNRLAPNEIVVLGGEGTISPSVEATLQTIAPTTRIGGPTRYEVAEGVAARIGPATSVVLASGELFSDALSAGPVAGRLGAPLLLMRSNDVPEATLRVLADSQPSTIYALGGPATISETALQQAAAAAGGATVIRYGGADRFEVATNAAKALWDASTTVFIASGYVFPDGLSGTPAAVASGAPLLLSRSDCLPATTASTLSLLGATAQVHVGGPASVTLGNNVCGESNPAASMAATLAIKGRAPQTGYDRNQFGPDWTDHVSVNGGHNGCDTRNDILRRDLNRYLILTGTNGCVVASGRLNDPYSGKVIDFVRGTTTSGAVQIDHVVALSDAWQKGAQQMTLAQRTEFANDPLGVLAVDGPTNSSKSDSDAATWLPPNKAFRCSMVSIQVNVKAKYGLWVTAAERDAIDTILNTCPGKPLPSNTNVPPLG